MTSFCTSLLSFVCFLTLFYFFVYIELERSNKPIEQQTTTETKSENTKPQSTWKPKQIPPGFSYLDHVQWTTEDIRRKRPDLKGLNLNEIPVWMIKAGWTRKQIEHQLNERKQNMKRNELRHLLVEGLNYSITFAITIKFDRFQENVRLKYERQI